MSVRPPHHPRACHRARRWVVRRRSPNVHVFRGTDRRWVVAIGSRVVSSYRTQGLATDVGRLLARRGETELVIHGRDGRFRSKDSYGNESLLIDTEH